jgi:hypothetical protein
MKTITRIVVLLLLGVILGLPLGIYLVQYKFIDKEKAVGMLSEEAIVDDFAKKEFIYADPQSARDALQYAIKIHKEMQNKSPLWGWPQKSDLGWCYAELSLIEESEGHTDVSGDYMTQAEQTLKELGMKDSSEAHIRELLRRTPATNHPSKGESK